MNAKNRFLFKDHQEKQESDDDRHKTSIRIPTTRISKPHIESHRPPRYPRQSTWQEQKELKRDEIMNHQIDYVMHTRCHLLGMNVGHDAIRLFTKLYLEILWEELDENMVKIQVDYEYGLALNGYKILMTNWMNPEYSSDGSMALSLAKKIGGIQFW